MRYDYRCRACNFEHVVEHSMKEDAHTMCPVCHNPDLYGKVISANPFLLVGEGWESHEKSGRYHIKGGT